MLLIILGIFFVLVGLLLLGSVGAVYGLPFVAFGAALILFRKKIYLSGKDSRDRYIKELNSMNEVLDSFKFEAWDACCECEIGSGSRQESISKSNVGDPIDIKALTCDGDMGYTALICVNKKTGKDVGVVRELNHRPKVDALMEKYKIKSHISSIEDRHTDASGDFKAAMITIECYKK